MRTRIGLAAAIAVVLLECLGSPEARAQAANTGAQAKARQPDVKRLEAQIKQFNRLLPRQARMLAEQPCGHRDCSVTIQMKEATVSIDGKDVKICVAVLPISLKFDQTSSGNPPKTITWTLSASTVGGVPVEFLEKGGITKIDDAKSQLNPDNSRTSTTKYGAKNMHNQTGEASYLPVIFRRLDAGPQACATADDPKIVNE